MKRTTFPPAGRQESPSSNTRLSSGLESLLQAIAHDDRPRVRKLLKAEPGLVHALVVKPRLYTGGFIHWLYAKDTPLHLAAAGHRAEIVKMLLQHGGDANAAHNHRRGRPLHYAADGVINDASFNPSRQVKTIRCLLDYGGDVLAADKNGATPLHRAVRARCAAGVECLLEAGGDPAARNHSGATPFHLAVQNTGRGGTGEPLAKAAQRRIIEAFLARGVSPHMKDGRGKSVLDWATTPWIQELLTSGHRPESQKPKARGRQRGGGKTG